MPLIRFYCPACKATLKLNHPSPEGKKIRCPTCKTVSPLEAVGPTFASSPATKPTPPKQTPPTPHLEIPPKSRSASKPAPPPPPKRPPAPPVEEEAFDPILDDLDELEPDPATLKPRPTPKKAAIRPPVEEEEAFEPVLDDEPAPSTGKATSPTKGGKKGFDVVPWLVLLIVLGYLGAAAAAYLGVFDGEGSSTPTDSGRRSGVDAVPDGVRDRDRGPRPDAGEALTLPARDAAKEGQLARQRQTQLTARRAAEQKVVEALAKTDATKGEFRGLALATLENRDAGFGAGNFCLAFSPDSSLLAQGWGAKAVKIWDLRTGKVKHKIDIPDLVHSVAFSADGRTLAVGCEDHCIRLYSVANGALTNTLSGHAHEVKSVAFSPDGKWLASVGSGGGDGMQKFFFWRMPDGQQIQPPRTPTFNEILFRPDSKVVAVREFIGPARLFDVATGRPYKNSFPSLKIAWAIAFSPDGWKLAVASGDVGASASKGMLRVHDLATGAHRELPLADKTQQLDGVAFTADGKTLITVENGVLDLWDVAKGTRRRSFKVQAYSPFTVSPGGRMLATRSGPGVQIWDLSDLSDDATGALLAAIQKFGQVEKAGLGYRVTVFNPTTPEQFGSVVKLPRLTSLKLSLGNNITDANLQSLKGQGDLEELELTGHPKVTDAGLAPLVGLKRLRVLKLSYFPGVTGAGLAHLKELGALETLDLTAMPITDAGLKHLEGLKTLKKLNLANTSVTDEGIEALKKALPDVVVSQS